MKKNIKTLVSEVPEPTYNAVRFSHSPGVDTEVLGYIVVGAVVLAGGLFIYATVATGGTILLPFALLIA